jgi:nucleotide-binding universal stress UspA family protein
MTATVIKPSGRVRASPPGLDWLGPEPARLRHILFASDLGSPSQEAFGHARFLAERFHASLTLCHLVDATRYTDPHAAERIARAADEARGRLETQAAGLRIAHHTLVHEAGAPGPALAGHVREAAPDLTVMATHGRGGMAHLLLGSVTETVLRTSGRPTLCVREPRHGPPRPYRRIVVPADLTAGSRRAFPLAALLARAFDAEVLVVHAPRSQPWPHAAAVHDAVRPDFAGLGLAICMAHPPAEGAVLELAARERADLIVTPGDAPSGLREAVGGSPVERMVRAAPCPVLVV